MNHTVKYFLTVVFGLSLCGFSGCATDNEFLAKMPLFEANSDRIPGLTPPRERKKQIELKGQKGATAPDAEKEILVAQLMVEYRTSKDPNMRRAAVDAMSKIPHAKRDLYMKEVLKDPDPFVRISALDAIGKSFKVPEEQVGILIESMKSDSDKDVRLRAADHVGILGAAYAGREKKVLPITIATNGEQAKRIESALSEMLLDKVPAMREQAMVSLHKVTGKDYGMNINRWLEYTQYTRGERSEAPKERSFAEKIPKPQLSMFK